MSFYTPTNAAPRPERSNLWAVGKYRCAITAAEMKPTKGGTGEYLKLEYTCLDDGPHKNGKQWENLNLKNPNAEAVRISREAMDELCWATGKLTLSQPSDLIGCVVVLDIKQKKNRETGDPENRIARYLKDEGPGAAASAPVAATTGAPKWAQTRPAA